MSPFLSAWDYAIDEAQLLRRPVFVGKWFHEHFPWPPPSDVRNAVIVARTMHPSFMQPKVPKFDPRRDHGKA